MKLVEILRPILDTKISRKLVSLIMYLAEKGECTVKELEKHLGISYYMVMYYIEHLYRHGLITVRFDYLRRRKIIRATERLKMLVKVLNMEINVDMCEKIEEKEITVN